MVRLSKQRISPMTQAITRILTSAKHGLATATFAVCAAFVAAPSSPIAALTPGVGNAHATGPCWGEFWVMMDAYYYYLDNPTTLGPESTTSLPWTPTSIVLADLRKV